MVERITISLDEYDASRLARLLMARKDFEMSFGTASGQKYSGAWIDGVFVFYHGLIGSGPRAVWVSDRWYVHHINKSVAMGLVSDTECVVSGVSEEELEAAGQGMRAWTKYKLIGATK